MPKDEQISGAPIPMKIGGEIFRARTLSDIDFDELNAYVRFRFIEEGRDSISRLSLPSESRQEMMTSLLLASSQVSFNSPEGARLINQSTEGMSRVGWQMIHHFHPKESVEEFLEKVKGDESDGHLISSLSEINRVFIYLNISIDNDDENGDKEKNEDEKSEDEGDSDKGPKSN